MITQHEIETQLTLAVLPFITHKRMTGVMLGPMHQPITDAIGPFSTTTGGKPPLEFMIRPVGDEEFYVILTKVGTTPILDALPRREVTGAYPLDDAILMPGDTFADYYRANPDAALHYSAYTEIALTLQPKSIIEIGVRAGYSAWAMLRAEPEALYAGIDLNIGTYGGVVGYLDYARQMLREAYPRVNVSVVEGDSQKSHALTRRYDLAHIDGGHDFLDVIHDLELCAPYCDHVLVDDVEFMPTVSAGVETFLERHPVPGWFYPTWRGGGMVLLDTRTIIPAR